MKQIICIENLNPRHDTMLNDLVILGRLFEPNELNKLILFIHTFTGEPKSLKEVRNGVLELDDFFGMLMINQIDKQKFVDEKIWVFNKKNPDLSEILSIIDAKKDSRKALDNKYGKSSYVHKTSLQSSSHRRLIFIIIFFFFISIFFGLFCFFVIATSHFL